MELKANFTHDCDCCAFAGSFLSLGEIMDVWVHYGEGGEGALIIRDGDKGDDYRSLPLWAARQATGLVYETAYMLYRSWKGGE